MRPELEQRALDTLALHFPTFKARCRRCNPSRRSTWNSRGPDGRRPQSRPADPGPDLLHAPAARLVEYRTPIDGLHCAGRARTAAAASAAIRVATPRGRFSGVIRHAPTGIGEGTTDFAGHAPLRCGARGGNCCGQTGDEPGVRRRTGAEGRCRRDGMRKYVLVILKTSAKPLPAARNATRCSRTFRQHEEAGRRRQARIRRTVRRQEHGRGLVARMFVFAVPTIDEAKALTATDPVLQQARWSRSITRSSLRVADARAGDVSQGGEEADVRALLDLG